jgi:hypothetical protein
VIILFIGSYEDFKCLSDTFVYIVFLQGGPGQGYPQQPGYPGGGYPTGEAVMIIII